MAQQALQGKLMIKAALTLVTGLHIGAGGDYAPIGAVDSPFIRDMLTQRPIIPGSSLKGKMRTLLARLHSTHFTCPIEADDVVLKRLFGAASKEAVLFARLQYYDLKLTEESAQRIEKLDTDTYIGEVKFENTINRSSGVANPRQIERVPAGAVFAFRLVYNVENLEELAEDLEYLAEGFHLLQMDYLGGHGSRGYGRVKFTDFSIEQCGSFAFDKEHYEQLLEESGNL